MKAIYGFYAIFCICYKDEKSYAAKTVICLQQQRMRKKKFRSIGNEGKAKNGMGDVFIILGNMKRFRLAELACCLKSFRLGFNSSAMCSQVFTKKNRIHIVRCQS